MSDEQLCPFSKPIFGKFCTCPHARLAERCSGKMDCSRIEDLYPACQALAELFYQRSRFVLGLLDDTVELTHAQAMKVRCGGLLGMQRVMGPQQQIPEPPQLIAQAVSQYGSVDGFPFSEIVHDIQAFSHRKKSRT